MEKYYGPDKIYITFKLDKTMADLLRGIAEANNMSRQRFIEALCIDCVMEYVKAIKDSGILQNQE